MKNSQKIGMIIASTVGLWSLLVTPEARATNLIKQPGAHPDYSFEATPHFLVAPFDGDLGVGAGFRGTFNIADTGFIKKLNDSVGITIGADYTNQENTYVVAAMQWNFWFTETWSAFGEPGFGWVFRGNGNDHFDGVFSAGGRWLFSSSASLTLRLGYPVTAIGVSFFL